MPYIFLTVILLAARTGLASDVDIGPIIELSPDRQFIQVHDQVYKVENLEKLVPGGKPEPASPEELAEGMIVRITRGARKEGYWHSRSMRILSGEQAKQTLHDMERPPRSAAPSPATQAGNRRPEKTIYLENGVWRN